MADERYYRTSGAAAYDVYSPYNNNTARPLPRQPQGLPEERPLPRREQRVKAKTAVAPFTLLGAVTVVCMLVLVIFGYVQLFEATDNVSKLETKLQSLQQEHAMLESKYEGRIDLEQIEKRAGELGLRLPTSEQTVYLNLSWDDRAEIYHEEKTSVLGEIIGAVEQSISDLIAYLRPAAA